ncbi:O-antigen ligase family protein [Mycobacterium adipatum]|uniref:O-antigen ligase family protein n=1 Tax=Mycobacterium adipatum TaxID=1682113 RepID=UPI0034E0C292
MAVVLVLVVLFAALSNRISRVNNLALVGMVGISTLVVASFLWTDEPAMAQTRSVTFGALALTSIALAFAFAYLGTDAVNSVRSGLVLGAAIASTLVIIARIKGDFVGAEEFQQVTMRSSAGAADPNDLALLLAAALPACVWSRSVFSRVLVSALVITGVLLTGSRGAILALAVGGGVALVALLSIRGSKAIPTVAWSAAISSIVVWGAWNLLPDTVAERIRSIPAELSSGSFTKRTTLWQAAWEQFNEHPILGSGVGTARHYIFQRSGLDLVTHNTHLSFLVELGFVGWALFIFALLVAWAGAVAFHRSAMWPLVTLAVLTTGTVSLSWEFNKLLWVMLVFGGFLLAQKSDAAAPDGLAVQSAHRPAASAKGR